MGRDDASQRLVLVSADCHAGPERDRLDDYIDARHADAFADYVTQTRRYDAQVAEIFAGRRHAELTEMHRVFIERDSVEGLRDPYVHSGTSRPTAWLPT